MSFIKKDIGTQSDHAHVHEGVVIKLSLFLVKSSLTKPKKHYYTNKKKYELETILFIYFFVYIFYY